MSKRDAGVLRAAAQVAGRTLAICKSKWVKGSWGMDVEGRNTGTMQNPNVALSTACLMGAGYRAAAEHLKEVHPEKFDVTTGYVRRHDLDFDPVFQTSVWYFKAAAAILYPGIVKRISRKPGKKSGWNLDNEWVTITDPDSFNIPDFNDNFETTKEMILAVSAYAEKLLERAAERAEATQKLEAERIKQAQKVEEMDSLVDEVSVLIDETEDILSESREASVPPEVHGDVRPAKRAAYSG